MNVRHLYLGSFFVVVGIITYFDITKCHRPPWPPRLLFAGLFFLLSDIFSIISEQLAGLMTVGMVLAFVLNKGFVSDCNYIETGTDQPASYKYMGQQPVIAL